MCVVLVSSQGDLKKPKIDRTVFLQLMLCFFFFRTYGMLVWEGEGGKEVGESCRGGRTVGGFQFAVSRILYRAAFFLFKKLFHNHYISKRLHMHMHKWRGAFVVLNGPQRKDTLRIIATSTHPPNPQGLLYPTR